MSDAPILSDVISRDPFKVSTKEIRQYLKKHHIKQTSVNIRRYRNAARKAKAKEQAPKGVEVSYSSPVAPWQIVYGETRVPAILTFLHLSNNKLNYNIVATVAAHKIDGVYGLYLDNHGIIFGGPPDGRWSTGPVVDLRDFGNGRVFVASERTGDENQTAQPDLMSQQPAYWTSNHRQQGCAHVYLILKWDALTFSQGLPDITFHVKGKPLYDPRSGLTAYSNNAALAIADYLTDTKFGRGYSWDEIDIDSLSDAADICDEDVPLRAGGTEKRYTVNGRFESTDSPASVLENLEAAMAGSVSFQNGKWSFWPGTHRTPESITLTEDDLRGEVRIESLAGRQENFNSIRGTFVAADKEYQKTDFPAVSVSAFVTEDGGEKVWQDFDYPFITSRSQAQRCARIELELVRRPLTLTAAFSLKAYPLRMGESCYVTLARYGWSAKEFQVVDYEFEISDDLELFVVLTLKAIDSGAYDWDESVDEQLVNEAPATSLPLPSQCVPPTNLTAASGTAHLYIRGDGTVFSRIYLQWNAPLDAFVTSGGKIEIQYKLTSSSVWLPVTIVDGAQTNAYISDVQDSQYYDVRIRSVNAVGVTSEWLTLSSQLVVGKTAAPSNVSTITGSISEYGIEASWPGISDLDLAFYEVRIGSSWLSSSLVTQTRATRVNIPITAAGSHTLRVKAVDTSGNYSATEATITFTITASNIPSATGVFDGPNFILSWSAATDGTWAVAEYNLYRGSTFGGATFITATRARSYMIRADWEMDETFWIETKDIFGNVGTPFSVTATVTAPGAVSNLRPETIDNNVLLRFSAPSSGTLPVAQYIVKKGEDYATAEVIGYNTGTFTVIIETESGNYTYWVAAIDTADNEGTPTNTAASVLEPPDYELKSNLLLTSGTKTNCVEHPVGTIIAPVVTGETWEDHYVNNGYTTAQDQIDDGYPYYLQPEAAYARWEKVVDLGTTIDRVLIHLAFTREDLVGSQTITPKIAYSTDNVSYTEESDVLTILAPSVRYYRIRLDFGTVP